MAAVKIVLNHASIGKLMRSPEMLADLEARARRIAAAAGGGFSVRTTTSATRAHATVFTETFAARHSEARDRVLTKALDAGR